MFRILEVPRVNHHQFPGQGAVRVIKRVRVIAKHAGMLQSERMENRLAGEGKRLAREGKTPMYCALRQTPGASRHCGYSSAAVLKSRVSSPRVVHPSTPEKERKATMKKVISIEGMNCGHCTGAVEKALRSLGGVKSAVADLASKSATVETEGEVSDEVLRKAVTDTGFRVVGIK